MYMKQCDIYFVRLHSYPVLCTSVDDTATIKDIYIQYASKLLLSTQRIV